MNKYKSKFKVVRNKDNSGAYLDIDDNYIPCYAKAEIYRYSDNTLAVVFQTRQYANNRLKDFASANIQVKELQYGDSESTYLFSESDFGQVAEIVKARKRKQFSEEHLLKLKERAINMAQKKWGKNSLNNENE